MSLYIHIPTAYPCGLYKSNDRPNLIDFHDLIYQAGAVLDPLRASMGLLLAVATDPLKWGSRGYSTHGKRATRQLVI